MSPARELSIAFDHDWSNRLRFGTCQPTGIVGYPAQTQWLKHTRDGELFVSAGYRWDGCSGPTIDDRSNARACLVHDGLYQLMRLGLLPLKLRPRVDKLFRRMLREDGMPWFRAWYYYQAVRMFGADSAAPGADMRCPGNDVN